MEQDLLAPILNVWVVIEVLEGVEISNVDLIQAQHVHIQNTIPKCNKYSPQ
jgi:hypothetical protein